MNRISVIKSALKLPAPDSIPRTGEKAQAVNCYVVELIDEKAGHRFLIKEKTEKGVCGIYWDNESLGNDTCLPNSEIGYPWNIEVTHYYKTWTHVYHDEIDFYSGKIISWHLIVRLFNGVAQHLFNRRTLRRSERIEILKYLVDETVINPNYVFNAILLGGSLYTKRWISHPNWQQSNAHLKLILESLVESEDLAKQDEGYKVEPKALLTLSEFENDERKHQDILNNAKVTRWLTVALVVAGIANVAVRLWLYQPPT